MPSFTELNGPLFQSNGEVVTPSSGSAYDLTIPSNFGWIFQADPEGSTPIQFNSGIKLGASGTDDTKIVGGQDLTITTGRDLKLEATDDVVIGPTDRCEVLLADAVGAKAFVVQSSTPADVFSVSSAGDVVIENNLTVKGTTTTTHSEQVNLGDNFLYENAGYTDTAAQTGGLVINVQGSNTTDTVAAGGFTAGVASTSNPTVATTSTGVFADQDIIQIEGANNADNDGLFEVLSHSANVLTIRGVGTTGNTSGMHFFQNQFTTDATVAGTIRKVTVSVLQANGGAFQILPSVTTTSGASFSDLGTTTGQSLQIAYEAGNTIDIDSTNGNLTFTADAGSPGDFLIGNGTALDVAVNTSRPVTIDATGANGVISLDAAAASNFSVAGASLTLATSGASGNILVNAAATGGTVDIDGTTVEIDATTGGFSIGGGAASDVTTTSGGLSVSAAAALDLVGGAASSLQIPDSSTFDIKDDAATFWTFNTTAGSEALYMTNSDLLWTADDQGDIGAAGANRPTNIYATTLIKAGAGVEVHGTDHEVRTTDGTGANSSNLGIRTGSPTGGDYNSGNLNLDVGTPSGAGTAGTLNIASTNATTIGIGNASSTTTLTGTNIVPDADVLAFGDGSDVTLTHDGTDDVNVSGAGHFRWMDDKSIYFGDDDDGQLFFDSTFGQMRVRATSANLNLQTVTSGDVNVGSAGDITLTPALGTGVINLHGPSVVSSYNTAGDGTWTVKTANTMGIDTDSAALVITTGDPAGGGSDSGSITIDSGTPTATAGVVNIGTTNASAVNISNSGSLTTIGDNLDIDGTQLTLGGAVILDNGGSALVLGNGTDYAPQMASLTTAERTALTATNGMIVYDETLTSFYVYENGSWEQLATGGDVGLQVAYDNDNSITLTNARDFDINVPSSGTAAITLDANAASNFSVAGAGLTLSTTTSGTLAVSSAGALNLTSGSASTWSFTGGVNVTGTVEFQDDQLLVFGNDADASINFDADGNSRLQFAGADLEFADNQDLLWASDGGADIGAVGANRPANVYATTLIKAGDGVEMYGESGNAHRVNTSDNGSGATVNLTVRSGNATGGNSGNLILTSGTTTTSGNSGNVAVDTGSAAGTAGTVAVAGVNASGLTLARAGLTTVVAGNLRADGTIQGPDDGTGVVFGHAGTGAGEGSALQVVSLTTTERGYLTGANGMIIYNETDSVFQLYENGEWVDVTTSSDLTLQDIYDNSGDPARIDVAEDVPVQIRVPTGVTGRALNVENVDGGTGINVGEDTTLSIGDEAFDIDWPSADPHLRFHSTAPISGNTTGFRIEMTGMAGGALTIPGSHPGGAIKITAGASGDAGVGYGSGNSPGGNVEIKGGPGGDNAANRGGATPGGEVQITGGTGGDGTGAGSGQAGGAVTILGGPAGTGGTGGTGGDLIMDSGAGGFGNGDIFIGAGANNNADQINIGSVNGGNSGTGSYVGIAIQGNVPQGFQLYDDGGVFFRAQTTDTNRRTEFETKAIFGDDIPLQFGNTSATAEDASLYWQDAASTFNIRTAADASTGKKIAIQTGNVTTGTSGNVEIDTGTGSVAAGTVLLGGNGDVTIDDVDLLWSTQGGGNIGADGATNPQNIYTNNLLKAGNANSITVNGGVGLIAAATQLDITATAVSDWSFGGTGVLFGNAGTPDYFQFLNDNELRFGSTTGGDYRMYFETGADPGLVINGDGSATPVTLGGPKLELVAKKGGNYSGAAGGIGGHSRLEGGLGGDGDASYAGGAGGNATLVGGTGGDTGAAGVSGVGGAAYVLGGNAGPDGNVNGGHAYIRGGNASGTGNDGSIILGDSNTSDVVTHVAIIGPDAGDGVVIGAPNATGGAGTGSTLQLPTFNSTAKSNLDEVAGMLVYTDTNELQYYNGASWLTLGTTVGTTLNASYEAGNQIDVDDSRAVDLVGNGDGTNFQGDFMDMRFAAGSSRIIDGNTKGLSIDLRSNVSSVAVDTDVTGLEIAVDTGVSGTGVARSLYVTDGTFLFAPTNAGDFVVNQNLGGGGDVQFVLENGGSSADTFSITEGGGGTTFMQIDRSGADDSISFTDGSSSITLSGGGIMSLAGPNSTAFTNNDGVMTMALRDNQNATITFESSDGTDIMLMDSTDSDERVRIPSTSYIAFGDATNSSEIREDTGDSELQILTNNIGGDSDSIRISPTFGAGTPGSIHLGVDADGTTAAVNIDAICTGRLTLEGDGSLADAVTLYAPNGGVEATTEYGILSLYDDDIRVEMDLTDADTEAKINIAVSNSKVAGTGDATLALDASVVGTGTGTLDMGGDVLDLADVGSVVGNSTAVSAGAHAAGTLLCIDTNGKLAPSDADAAGRKYTVGISRNATTAADQAVDLQSVHGTVCVVKTDISALNNGQVVYLATTAGDVTGTAPSSSGDVVFRVGHIIDKGTGAGDGKIIFMPQYVTTIA